MFGLGKGKMVIEIPKYSFSPGETVQGTIRLELKKPQHGAGVFVGIVGSQRIRRLIGTTYQNQKVNVYKFRQPLDSEREYAKGVQSYRFRIRIPVDVEMSKGPEGNLGKILKTAERLTFTSKSIEWKLVASFDIPKGRDIKEEVQISVV